MKKLLLLLILVAAQLPELQAQSLEKPQVALPSIMKPKKTKYSSNKGGYMGLWDWNFGVGYIDKTEQRKDGASLANEKTNGVYTLFQLQESMLSNYFWARKKNKRVKFGLQNTATLGIKMGPALDNSAVAASKKDKGSVDYILDYQAGLALAVRVSPKVDVGFTYYPYVYSSTYSDVGPYSKFRVRVGRLMCEYSAMGKQAIDVKYLRGRKLYMGVSYTHYEQNTTNYLTSSTTTNTNWIHLNFGRVF
jgi:hypothetical protein